MPGSPLLTATSPAASAGYGAAGYPYPTMYGGQYPQAGPSHGSFVVWLIVFALISVAVLGGLKVGGFSFVFRTR